MQHLEVSGAVRTLYGSLGVKGLIDRVGVAIVEIRPCDFLPFSVQGLISCTARLNCRELYINVF